MNFRALFYILFVLLTSVSTTEISLAQDFTLKYKDNNSWAETKDDESLSQLFAVTKQTKEQYFKVQVNNSSEVNSKRLSILRDLLQKQLGSSVILDVDNNKKDSSKANQVIVSINN